MIVFTSLQDPKLLELLKKGAVGILPTDTIYGLVTDAANRASVQRLYTLKEREHKPGTIVAGSVEQVVELGIAEHYVAAVAHVWPNPVSIVLPAPPALAYLDQGLASLAIRVPKDTSFQAFLLQTGPLLTSSANRPGEAVAATMEEAQAVFGDGVDFYVDGGDRGQATASTVARLEADGTVATLREGTIRLDKKGTII